jgi:hypothetical protein
MILLATKLMCLSVSASRVFPKVATVCCSTINIAPRVTLMLSALGDVWMMVISCYAPSIRGRTSSLGSYPVIRMMT